MKTKEQSPWVSYLEIDENTGKRFLRDDAPEDIRRKYEDFLKERQNNPNKMLPK